MITATGLSRAFTTRTGLVEEGRGVDFHVDVCEDRPALVRQSPVGAWPRRVVPGHLWPSVEVAVAVVLFAVHVALCLVARVGMSTPTKH